MAESEPAIRMSDWKGVSRPAETAGVSFVDLPTQALSYNIACGYNEIIRSLVRVLWRDMAYQQAVYHMPPASRVRNALGS